MSVIIFDKSAREPIRELTLSHELSSSQRLQKILTSKQAHKMYGPRLMLCFSSTPQFEKLSEEKFGLFPIEKIVDCMGRTQIYSKPTLTFFFSIDELKRRGVFPLRENHENGGLLTFDGSMIFLKKQI